MAHRPSFVACTLILLSGPLTACTTGRTLHSTFGQMNRELFAAQAQEHATREISPMRGEEAKRVINTYYSGIGDSPTGGMHGGSGGSPSGGGH
jgi:hypothetical protein